MTTETTDTPADPIVAAWSDNLEAELIEAGMDQPEAHAYRQAFELGLTRIMSVVATKQDLKEGLADLRDDLRHEMELRFAQVDRRFSDVDRRFDEMQAHNDQRFADIDRRFADIDQRFEESQRVMDQRFAEAQRRTDQQFASLEKLMMAKFDDVDKRIRLLAAATGVGFAMVIGFLSAIVVLVA